MKKLIYLLSTISIILSSCSDEMLDEMTVIKNCTGSYLNVNDKNYKICNFEVVDNFENGSIVQASFDRIDSCPAHDKLLVCDMYFHNEGWIYINKIR